MKEVVNVVVAAAFALFGVFSMCCGLLLCFDSTLSVDAVLLIVGGLIFILTSKSMPKLLYDGYQLAVKFVHWYKN